MLVIAVALFLVGIAVFMILQPIISGQIASEGFSEDEPSEAQFRKRVSLLQLRDAEYEYAMGKLGEEDYQALKKEISAEALAAIRAEKSELEGPLSMGYSGADSELEEEIARVRETLGKAVFCSECGERNPPGSRFCAECGTPMKKPEPSGTT